MNSRKVVTLCSGMLASLGGYVANGQSMDPARPNILLVIAEDMSYNDISCYGNTDVRTPNLEKFASESVRYTNAFTTGAVCSATRSGLITGMYQTSIQAHNHRTLGPDKQPLPECVLPITFAIREAGYTPVLCMHEDPKWGKQNPGSWGSGKTDFNFKFDEKTIFDTNNWNKVEEGKPFFGYLTLQASHRGKWWRDIDQVRKDGINPDKLKTIAPYYPDNEVTRNDYAAYYDAVETVDKNFGEIISRLEEEGLLNSIIIVFMSDHGRPMPRDKQFCWDEGIHVPLMVRYPDKKGAGTVNDKLISSIDISAQVIKWTGAEIPPNVHGVPFAEAGTTERKYTISARDRCDETVHRIRAVRTKDYLYIRNFDPEVPFTAQNRYKDTRYPILINERELFAKGELPDNVKPFFAPQKPKEELYDMRKDPRNLNNIADNLKMKKVMNQMRGYLNEWLTVYPDYGQAPESQEVMERIIKQRIEEYGF